MINRNSAYFILIHKSNSFSLKVTVEYFKSKMFPFEFNNLDNNVENESSLNDTIKYSNSFTKMRNKTRFDRQQI